MTTDIGKNDAVDLDFSTILKLIGKHKYYILIILLVTYTAVFWYYNRQETIFNSEINVSTQTFDIFDASLNTSTASSYNFGNAEMYDKRIFFIAYRDALHKRANIIESLRVYHENQGIQISADEEASLLKLVLKNLKTWDWTREEKIKIEWLGLVKNGLLLSNNVAQIELEYEISNRINVIAQKRANLAVQKSISLEELRFNLEIAKKLNFTEISLPPYPLKKSKENLFNPAESFHYAPFSSGDVPLYFYGTKLLEAEIVIVEKKEANSSDLESSIFSLSLLKKKIEINKKIAIEAGITEKKFQYAAPGSLIMFSTIQDILKPKNVVNYNLDLIRSSESNVKIVSLLILSTLMAIFSSLILILLRWKFLNYRV